MANNGQRKGLFARLTSLPERSEDYARKTMPTNRWSLGWDLFKTNLGKIVKINLLMLLFCFPIFLLMLFNSFMVQANAMSGPFSQNIGLGYPIYPSLSGISEIMTFQVDLITCGLALILVFYVAVGISGGFYVMRNMVWTEGVFVMSDFWSGVKKNYGVIIKSSLLFLVFFSISILTIDMSSYQIAIDPSKTTIFTVSKVFSYVLLVVFTIMYLYSITLGVTYEVRFFQLIKNSFILSIALIPVNVFFALFSLITFLPFLFNSVPLILTLGIVLVLFLGLGVFALIWTNYSQWVFDQFINDKVPGAVKNRGMNKARYGEEEETSTYVGPSILTSKPIKPITDYDIEIHNLPESYSREDLIKLEESKKAMMEDSDRYSEEHMEDFLKNKQTIDDFMSDDEEEIRKEEERKAPKNGKGK